MKKFFVVGNPISHSLSPRIHAEFARQAGIHLDYQALELPQENFASNVRKLFFEGGVSGLSVTAPFKLQAYELSDIITAEAHRAKAVNTLWVQDGKIHGDNTDGRGLVQDLSVNHQINVSGKKILILGAGGAAQGIAGPLQEAGALITVVNRTPLSVRHPLAGLEIHALATSSLDLVINATSVGLVDAEVRQPLEKMMKGVFAYDLNYSPSHQTPFTEWALQRGAQKAVDGMGMLIEQARLQFEIFHGVRPIPLL